MIFDKANSSIPLILKRVQTPFSVSSSREGKMGKLKCRVMYVTSGSQVAKWLLFWSLSKERQVISTQCIGLFCVCLFMQLIMVLLIFGIFDIILPNLNLP